MRNDVIKIAPSILAADFARLGEQVAEAERAGADWIHIDVMDGHFVPNIAIGAPIVQSLRRVTSLPVETHFMVSDPDSQHFLQSTLRKIQQVSQMIEQMKPDRELGVDGGIDEATAPLAVAAGANVLVAGSSIFAASQGVKPAIESLRAAITQAAH